jgi:small-conductance mechanosensitive channel
VPHIVAESFTERHGDTLTAIGTIAVAVVALIILDRFLVRRAARVARTMTGGDLSAEAATRLRFARRVLEATILLFAIAVALRQFADIDRVASAILASGAIAAAIVGFAARQVLANAVAGIMLAVSQPLRIGDLVTFEEETGTVEDIRLTTTWLRTGADARIVIPNERLAAGILRNDSIGTPTVAVEASVWLAPEADETKALESLHAMGVRARIAEVTFEGMRVLVMGDAAPVADRLVREGDLRRDALRALREAGVR